MWTKMNTFLWMDIFIYVFKNYWDRDYKDSNEKTHLDNLYISVVFEHIYKMTIVIKKIED